MGQAIARRLAEAGADLLIGDKDGDAAGAAAEALSTQHGVRARGRHLDVASSHSVAGLARPRTRAGVGSTFG